MGAREMGQALRIIRPVHIEDRNTIQGDASHQHDQGTEDFEVRIYAITQEEKRLLNRLSLRLCHLHIHVVKYSLRHRIPEVIILFFSRVPEHFS